MEINQNIYKINGFRLFGLNITDKTNIIDNRMTKVEAYKKRFKRKDASYDDTNPLEGVFDKGNVTLLLPVSPAPSYIDYQNARNRLTDVRTRLLDEIFWFWPKTLEEPLEEFVIKYLNNNDYDSAKKYWESQSKTESTNTTSVHNLAVINHIRALELFEKEDYDAVVYLTDAIKYWSLILSGSNNFKNFVKQRVNSLNDPRLTNEYVDEIFEQLPADLLNINISLIKNLSKSSNISERNLRLINGIINATEESSFDSKLINRTASKILETFEHSIKNLGDSFDGKFNSAYGSTKLDILVEYENNVEPFMKILTQDLFYNNSISNKMRDSVCQKMLSCLNNEELLSNAMTDNKIQKIVEILEFISRFAADEDLKQNAVKLKEMIKDVPSDEERRKQEELKRMYEEAVKQEEQKKLNEKKQTQSCVCLLMALIVFIILIIVIFKPFG
ncbi:MAG: hypothetical protein E7Z84_01620 [Methanosphaera stadtmanae]|nr:hypothetical protein [Methanosphaera stadtmanae]